MIDYLTKPIEAGFLIQTVRQYLDFETRGSRMKRNLVVIGSSAGGPRTLKTLFEGMPRIDAAVLIVQHMPKFINGSLAKDISRNTAMSVGLAEAGDILEHGVALSRPAKSIAS
ncbi:MAG: hypothetical protein MZU84_02285 [Sphingobacterium sp.]|nr:hypothetical protein [Sphingobacterium sp.]